LKHRALKVAFWGLGAILTLGVAAWLALQRPDIPYPTLERKYANAASRFMDLPGGLHVHYRDQGDREGPPVVMVHGFGASLDAWEPWMRRLGGRYRIVTLDLPAHGLTRAPSSYVMNLDNNAEVVDALTQRLGLGRYVAVGNSMGGGVAWTLALRHPDHVRALVLVDSVGWPTRDQTRGSPLIFKILASPIGRAILRDIDIRPLIEQGLAAAYVDRRLVTPALIDRYADQARAPGHREIILANQRRQRQPSPDVFRSIRMPTLVLHGDADVLIPVSAGRSLAAAIPGARLVTYPGVGHVPMDQIPDRSAADVAAFLATLDQPTASAR
jgi:pimeloyl-ACP methyl ester carboxylesterase